MASLNIGADESTTIRAVAAAVRDKRVRASDIVIRALELIARHNPAINAVVALRSDEALADAELLDRQLAEGVSPGRLAGVPVLVKDLEDVEGMVTTKGSSLFADALPATQNGLVPSRLRAAGAIIVGKTNLSEFATEAYTANLLHGATINPWNAALSPGGSSGGSAAALAAGLVPIATATDGGGSIRIPAAFCGLVGLKPTHGVVGRSPIPDWIDLSTDGPIANSVADLRLLLDIEAGPVRGDPDAFPYPRAAHAAATGRLFAAQRIEDTSPLPLGVAGRFERAVDAFADLLGLPVRWLQAPDVFPAGDPASDWRTIASAEHVSSLGREWVIRNLPRMNVGAQAFLESGLDVSLDEYASARRRRFVYTERMDSLLGDNGLLLTPTVAAEGWLPDGRLTPSHSPGVLPSEAISTTIQNLTGHPALSLPAGFSENGLPFGLQLTAPRFADEQLLDIARLWERSFPWPRVAPSFVSFEAWLE